jgi:hypothetical protein
MQTFPLTELAEVRLNLVSQLRVPAPKAAFMAQSPVWQLRFEAAPAGTAGERAVAQLAFEGLPTAALRQLTVLDGRHEVFCLDSVLDSRGHAITAGEMLTAISYYTHPRTVRIELPPGAARLAQLAVQMLILAAQVGPPTPGVFAGVQ